MNDEKFVGNEPRMSDESVILRSWHESLKTGMHKTPIKERVDAMTLIQGYCIKEIDLLTVKRFIQFCRFNTKNDWGVGLKLLLDFVESDSKTVMLYDKITAVESRVEAVEATLNKPPQEKKTPTTFGGDKDE